jgi:hypothetical protein
LLIGCDSSRSFGMSRSRSAASPTRNCTPRGSGWMPPWSGTRVSRKMRRTSSRSWTVMERRRSA